jgi:RND family efflux transporter MFP subunit
LPIIVGVLAVVAACTGKKKKRRRGRRGRLRGPAVVRVEKVRRGSIQSTASYPGEIQAAEAVEVAAKIPARIKRVLVKMGENVKKGQLLVTLDAGELWASLKEARAAVAVHRASLKRASAEAVHAALELARKSKLARRDLVSKQELDNVRSRHDTARASMDLARAQGNQAAARITVLKQQLAQTRIRAPFDAQVASRTLDPGAVVNPGKTILRLLKVDKVIARFKVPERDIGRLKDRMAKGQAAVSLKVHAYPGREFFGKVVRTAPGLEPASRTVAVEAEVANPDDRLMPGMYTRVKMNLGKRENALLLPLRALLERRTSSRNPEGATSRRSMEDGQLRVYVVREGRARLSPVVLGLRSERHAEILSGLAEGASVVVEGKEAVREGRPVRVVGRLKASPPGGKPKSADGHVKEKRRGAL